jgi:hypothetical protein
MYCTEVVNQSLNELPSPWLLAAYRYSTQLNYDSILLAVWDVYFYSEIGDRFSWIIRGTPQSQNVSVN